MAGLHPTRRRGEEILDRADVDPAVRARSLADVAVSNRLLGGRRALLIALRRVIPSLDGEATLLDVGTGDADLAEVATREAARAGKRLRAIGLDGAVSLLDTARRRTRIDDAVCADALALPCADRSVDVVLCSQLLHHFDRDAVHAVIAELNRVARTRVIVCDLQRSWLAAAGFWLVSWPLRFSPVTRHDGTLSVLRGFTRGELRDMVLAATGVRPRVRRRLGFRLVATWTP